MSNINQAELERYQRNQRLKACVKKYVIEDYKAASSSERALQKAQNLLLSYADIVYTEEELLSMKQEVKFVDEMLDDNTLIN